MKAIHSLLIVTLAGGALMAQTPAQTQTKPSPTKAVAPATSKPVAASQPAVAKPAVQTEKPKTAEKKAPAHAAKASVKPEKVAKPASAKEQQEATRVSAAPKTAARRDPFVSPIVRATGGVGPVCETGKRCLVVDQIMLKGIVKSPNGYIAVVENPARRAYFLRENDPVFNGSVVKITGDSVVFRQQVTDKLGKQEMKEVVKKVNAPVV